MKKRKSKLQKQLEELQKRFDISEHEFSQYYRNVRKANIKGQRMKKQGNAFYVPKYSYGVKHIKTREDFDRYFDSVYNVLSPTYRVERNLKHREILYNNLIKIFGSEGGEYLINQFEKMSDRDLKAFFDKNDDLEILFYDSDTEIGKFMDWTVATFDDRIDSFSKNG